MRKFFFQTTAGVIAAVALASALSGCGKRVTDSNLSKVKAEMTMKEVESILGHPTRANYHDLTLQTQMKTLPASRYYYDQDGRTVELIFVGDRLKGHTGNFDGTAPEPEKEQKKP